MESYEKDITTNESDIVEPSIYDPNSSNESHSIGTLSSLWKIPELKDRFIIFLSNTATFRKKPDSLHGLIDMIESSKHKSEADLYNALFDYITEETASDQEIQGVFDPTTWDRRASGRVNQILRLLPYSFYPKRILDLGCSEGSITSSLGRSLGLSPNFVFGVDVRQDNQLGNVENINDKDGFVFKLVDDGDPLPFDDNSLSLVTTMMVLHHIKDPIQTIKEIFRVLKPGGYFVYREHDCGSEGRENIEKDHTLFSLFLDVVHGIYSCVISSPREMTGEEFFKSFYSNYRSRKSWEALVESEGFELFGEDSYIKKHDLMASYCVSYRKPDGHNKCLDSKHTYFDKVRSHRNYKPYSKYKDSNYKRYRDEPYRRRSDHYDRYNDKTYHRR